MGIECALDVANLQVALTSADRISAKPSIATLLESCAGIAQLRHARSKAASRLHEFEQEGFRRKERQEKGIPEPEMPREYTCPIMMETMVDPVLAADGHTYERSSIERWLRDHRTSPKTNEVLANRELIANIALRVAICDWPAKEHARLVALKL